MSLAKNIKRIRENVSDETKLIVVTKTHSIREINQLAFLGVTDIGENKIQEIKFKKSQVKSSNLKWHMIGHLQSNKAKEAVQYCDMIQSVDSLKLAKKIDSAAKSQNKVMAVLIQVNFAKEPQKNGFIEEELVSSLKEISQLKNLKVLGLMMMAPFIESEKTRVYFRGMNNLFNKIRILNLQNIDLNYLSMGMSNDYKVAFEEGSNMVRIGSAIFENEKNENKEISKFYEEERD